MKNNIRDFGRFNFHSLASIAIHKVCGIIGCETISVRYFRGLYCEGSQTGSDAHISKILVYNERFSGGDKIVVYQCYTRNLIEFLYLPSNFFEGEYFSFVFRGDIGSCYAATPHKKSACTLEPYIKKRGIEGCRSAFPRSIQYDANLSLSHAGCNIYQKRNTSDGKLDP